MEKRRLGKTEHMSTIAILGGAGLWTVTQEVADTAVRQAIEAGVNHIDVAPQYGVAQERLGPWMAKERDRFFLGCKTMERSREGAQANLDESLKLLQVDSFDLYQLHGVNNMADLEMVTGPGGALEVALDARQKGLTRFIGITGHGPDVPSTILEALDRFDFDTVLFPMSFILFTDPDYLRDSQKLLQVCQERDVGVMNIKSVAKAVWGDREKKYMCWYEPFDTLDTIQPAVDFALSQPVTGLCTVGDPGLMPLMLEACENFTPMDEAQQAEMLERGRQYQSVFVEVGSGRATD